MVHPLLHAVVAILVAFGIIQTCFAADGDKIKEVFAVPTDPVVAAELRDALQDIRRMIKSPAQRIRLVNELLMINKGTLYREVIQTKDHATVDLQNAIEILSEASSRQTGMDASQQQETLILQRSFVTGLLEARLTSVTDSKNSIMTVNSFLNANKQEMTQTFKVPRPVQPAFETMIAEMESTKPTQTNGIANIANLQIAAFRARFSAATPKARIAAMNQLLKENAKSSSDIKSQTSQTGEIQTQTLTQ